MTAVPVFSAMNHRNAMGKDPNAPAQFERGKMSERARQRDRKTYQAAFQTRNVRLSPPEKKHSTVEPGSTLS